MGVSRGNIGDNSGFSLLETVIVTGIIGFIAFSLAQIIASSNRATKSIAQKIEMVNLNHAMIQTLVNETNCSCQLSQPTYAFDSTAGQSTIDLGFFKTGCGPSDVNLAQQGQKLPGTQSGLIVEKVLLTDIRNSGAPGSLEYTASLSVSFDPASLVMARHNVTVPIRFIADAASVASARTIQNCSQNSYRLACASAVVASATGTATLTGSSGYSPSSVDEVFTYRGGAANRSDWGIGCKAGWIATGCALENNMTTANDSDVRIDNNFCHSDGDEFDASGGGSTMYTTCCKIMSGP